MIPTGDPYHPIDYMIRHRLTAHQLGILINTSVRTIHGWTRASRRLTPPPCLRWALMYFEEHPELVEAAALAEHEPGPPIKQPPGFVVDSRWTPAKGIF